ncbi:MAG: ATP-grasp domain-containing protein [Opitutales bacterium]
MNPRSSTVRILLTSAGRRVELLRCFRESAAQLGLDMQVFAADMDPAMSTACQFADRARALPPCASDEYADAVLALCVEEGISLVVPTIDPELLPLARRAEDFAGAGVTLHLSPPEMVSLCRNKLHTARALAACGVPVPRSCALGSRGTWSAWEGPLIIKPSTGSSSLGVHRCRSAAEATALMPFQPEHCIVQELVQGDEYTVNCFFDIDGKLRCAVPHLRISVRQGEVYKGRTTRVRVLMEAAKMLERLPSHFRGAICFQAILSGDGARVFEINPRFGGGYPLAHHCGGSFSQWLLEELIGREPGYRDDWREGVTMLRYDQSVFLDS